MTIFDPKTDAVIIKFMLEEGRKHKKPFSELSKKIKFSTKQICHRWNEQVDPRIERGPLCDKEKEFINQWVKENRKSDGKIRWTRCQNDLKLIFNKLRSTNKIKNAWSSEQKRLARKEYMSRITSFKNDDNHKVGTTEIIPVFTSTAVLPPTLQTNFHPGFKQPDKMRPVF
ncbi:12228_t:CDS:2 [Funneliformis mosseae]|uniref:12228_t:CDS:1 n=1 Tax=Funneliformis mosseae TaxID=27381 RepID=A0A9N9BG05_FUNMO|nr:12228_t:CDS:2 [Funneliformis mosseae]